MKLSITKEGESLFACGFPVILGKSEEIGDPFAPVEDGGYAIVCKRLGESINPKQMAYFRCLHHAVERLWGMRDGTLDLLESEGETNVELECAIYRFAFAHEDSQSFFSPDPESN